MTNLNVCEKTKSGNILTCEGRMAYVAFFKPTLPQGETDQAKERYQGTLAFPKSSDLAILNEAIEQCAVDTWGPDYKKKHKVKKPFLKTEDSPKIGLDAEEFPVFIRTNSKDKPQIVDAKMTNVTEDKASQVYSGRWGRYSVRPYAYDHPTGGKGISLGLQNVQILRDDESLGGMRSRAEDDFVGVEVPAGAAGGTDALFE